MKSIDAAKGFSVATTPLTFRIALFHGPDAAASTELARQLTERLASNSDDILAITPASLKDDPARLGDEAAAVSMFGNLRVIQVDGAGEDCLEAFELLLGLPAAGNPAIITAGILRKGSKLLQLVETAPDALVIISYEPDARDSVRGVIEGAAKLGLNANRDAANRLNDATTGDRGLIRQELEKCAVYLDATPADPKALTVEHLLEIGADISDDDFRPLVDAVSGGRPQDADRQLRRLAAAGIPGIPLLRAVSRRLCTLLDLRSAVDGGMSPDGAVNAARPPVFWKEKPALTLQLQRWRSSALHHGLDRLLAAEREIKSRGSAGDVLAGQALLGIAVLASREG